MGGDGRLSRRLELPESASTVLSESSALKMLHLQVPLYILGVRSWGYVGMKPGITFANHSDDVCIEL